MSVKAIFHQLGIDNVRRGWDNTPWSFVLASGTHSIKAACLLVSSNAVAPILSERVAQAYLQDRSSPFYARNSGNAVMLPFASCTKYSTARFVLSQRQLDKDKLGGMM